MGDDIKALAAAGGFVLVLVGFALGLALVAGLFIRLAWWAAGG